MPASPSVAFPSTPPLSIFLQPPLYHTPVTASLMEWISVLLITFFPPCRLNEWCKFIKVCAFPLIPAYTSNSCGDGNTDACSRGSLRCKNVFLKWQTMYCQKFSLGVFGNVDALLSTPFRVSSHDQKAQTRQITFWLAAHVFYYMLTNIALHLCSLPCKCGVWVEFTFTLNGRHKWVTGTSNTSPFPESTKIHADKFCTCWVYFMRWLHFWMQSAAMLAPTYTCN